MGEKALTIIKKTENNIGQVISLAFMAGLIIFAFGCQPKTKSLIYPEKKIDRAALITEMDYLQSRFTNATNDLDKQEKIRNIILQQSLTIANTGDINPLGIITSLMALFGAGASVDNVRLRKKAKNDLQNKGHSKA